MDLRIRVPLHQISIGPDFGRFLRFLDIIILFGVLSTIHCEGVVLAAATRHISCYGDVGIAECQGIRMGIQFAKELSFLNLQVESDCLAAVSTIHQGGSLPSPISLIASDCLSFRSCFSFLDFLHIRRSQNNVAHSLAKVACSAPDQTWIEECPSCIATAVAFDCHSISNP
ncbi:Ribonuclease H-like superfamily [Sesbania bispinosa]|nr:Ribonuclease H-like superfamily [Sesbania bispinosa]